MKPDIVNASVASIDHNPFRNTRKYPFVKAKIDALKKSFEAVGVWEGIIVRKRGNRYELAFGHHRVEAARQLGLTRIPLIVRALDDKSMLQFMGRENGEDFNSDFLCLLETWEAGLKWLISTDITENQAIENARLLGWTVQRSDNKETNQMSMPAAACNAAHALIKGGYISRNDLSGMSVSAAREITERAYARMKQLDAVAKQRNLTPRETEASKQQYAKAAKAVAHKMREGKVATSKLRDEVDSHAYALARNKVKATPLFSVFADALVKQIGKCLVDDGLGERLAQMEKNLNSITLDADFRAVEKVQLALQHHEKVTATWQRRLTHKREKVVNLRALPGSKK